MQAVPSMAGDAQPESTPAGTFTKIDVPGAGTSPGEAEGTYATAINESGAVTGMYSNSLGVLHGFARDRFGTIAKFDAKNSGSGSIEGTLPLSINSSGWITGTIIDSNHVSWGFVRDPSGKITEFEAKGAGTAKDRGTTAWRINDNGDVVGFFSTGSASTPTTYHGFLRKANGTIANIDDPKAGSGENSTNGKKQGTQAYSINNAGEIVGSYVDSGNDRHGFLYVNGGFTDLDAPGAIKSTSGHGQGLNGTIPTAIDNEGIVVGAFTDATGRHGFVRNKDGSFKVFNGPGAAASSAAVEGTFPFYMDPPSGYVAGIYASADSVYHGFVRSPEGVVTAINAPGPVGDKVAPFPGAGAGGVNEHGEVVGGYSDAKGVYHGFIFTPASSQVAAPTFLPKQESHVGPLSVQIKDATTGATIYYTVDKTPPPTSKTTKKYSGPIAISKTTTIKAIAVKSGLTNSSIATATYTILKAQTISWAKITGTYTVGKTLALKATATSGLPVSFASTTTKICKVLRTTASFVAAGNCTIRATQAGNGVYGPAPPVSQTIAVKAK
ncbi:MAG TPA: FN3 associated domain-containing protein [Terracidiphilus sp.]|nr:FN3 associated domain-containing protein [Terracidiphilus sp.]